MKTLKPICLPHLVQGSPEWHAFRDKGFGSSDAALISSNLPEAWDGFYSMKLYRSGLAKKSFSPEKEIVIKRGQDLEEPARQAYMELTGIKMTPACFIHPRRSWHRSSLDGIDDPWTTILEIKCSGEKVYNKAAHDSQIPNYYIPQMMHQAATVPSVTNIHFWMWDPVRGGVLFELKPDPVFIRELIRREKWMWEVLQTDRRIYSGMLGAPIKINKDWKVLHNPHQGIYHPNYKELKPQDTKPEGQDESGQQNLY